MAAKSAFTDRETQLLTIAFQCLKQKPEIDYDLMAAKAGLKGAKSARDSFGPLYNKIVAGKKGAGNGNGEGDEDADTAAPSPKKKATPRKRKADAGGDDDEEEISPIKKKATPRKGKSKKEEVVEDEAEVGENIVVKPEAVGAGEANGDDV